jgi:hypothetical protein
MTLDTDQIDELIEIVHAKEPALLSDLLAKFESSFPDHLQCLRQAYNARNSLEIEKFASQLNSGARSIGLIDLSDQAAKIMTPKILDEVELQSKIESLESLYLHQINELRQYLCAKKRKFLAVD